jgi:hypothetical protein
MGKPEKLSKPLDKNNEPEGVTVSSADGRLFFLTKEDADRFSIPANRLYAAFRATRSQSRQPHGAEKDVLTDECMTEWEWLESHGPYSPEWRRRCLKYFDKCV